MDIDFRWGGDPSIILAVDSIFASLPIQVSDDINLFSHTYIVRSNMTVRMYVLLSNVNF